jgi:hypothetical protein
MIHEHRSDILVDLVEGDDDFHTTVQVQHKKGERLGHKAIIFWQRLWYEGYFRGAKHERKSKLTSARCSPLRHGFLHFGPLLQSLIFLTLLLEVRENLFELFQFVVWLVGALVRFCLGENLSESSIDGLLA